MDIHESPEAFYSRIFLQQLRIPALKNMGFSQEDVYALEDCLRQALMNLPLPRLWTSFTLNCLAACASPRLSARTTILRFLLRLLRLNGISNGLRALRILPPVLSPSMRHS